MARRLRNSLRPRLERLEDRLAPASYTINDARDLADDDLSDTIAHTREGTVTLRAVLETINAHKLDVSVGFDNAAMSIGGNYRLDRGVVRLEGRSGITITGQLVLKGSGHLVQSLQFEGSSLKPGMESLIVYDNTIIRDCEFRGSASPVALLGNSSRMIRNKIRTTGSDLDGNQVGVQVAGVKNYVGGYGADEGNSILSENPASKASYGVYIARLTYPTLGPVPTENYVVNNFIGLNADGHTTSGFNVGVSVAGASNELIGNKIAGFTRNGVVLYGERHRLYGNNIGTDTSGTVTRAGQYAVEAFGTNHTIGLGEEWARNVICATGDNNIGIWFHGGTSHSVRGNYIGVGRDGLTTFGTGIGIQANDAKVQIGGQEYERNYLCGKTAAVALYRSHDSVVSNNYIGVSRVGFEKIGGQYGLTVVDSNNVVIRGDSGGQLIAGNGTGVLIFGGSGQRLTGNYFGLAADGVSRVPGSDYGIEVSQNVSRVTIGGTTATDRNVIASDIEGVRLFGTKNRVIGNYIGLGADGYTLFGNATGVLAQGDNNTIGGSAEGERNVISGNYVAGVILVGRRNRVVGNYIGTGEDGITARGNDVGVLVLNQQNIVGGYGLGEGNVIAGQTVEFGGRIRGIGVEIASSEHLGPAIGNLVAGNFIGVGRDGHTVVPNKIGVSVQGSGNTVGGLGTATGNVIYADDVGVLVASPAMGQTSNGNVVRSNLIGTRTDGTTLLLSAPATPTQGIGIKLDGTRPMTNTLVHGNVIGDTKTGIEVLQPVGPLANRLSGTKITGNRVGVGSGDLAAIRNLDGIVLDGATGIRVGGTVAKDGNVIGANQRAGIRLVNAANKNTLIGNWIGTNADGADLGNGRHGVWIEEGSENVLGTPLGLDINANLSNKIAFNGFKANVAAGERGHAVRIDDGIRNTVRGNSFTGNKGLSIYLTDLTQLADELPQNDVAKFVAGKITSQYDADDGANKLQNYPTLAFLDPVKKVMKWQLNSTPSSEFKLDFYVDDAVHELGHGQGTRFLKTITKTTDPTGFLQVEVPFVPGQRVTATATDKLGNTSAFALVDQDADALADGWEINGIDIDMDGKVDQMLAGANPLKKDLYVEVDAVAGALSGDAAGRLRAIFNRIEAAFALASEGVGNPDGKAGVVLHINPDAGDLTFIPREQVRADGSVDLRQDFAKLRAGSFGPGIAGGAAFRARSLAYRYGLLADLLAKNGTASPKTAGLGENFPLRDSTQPDGVRKVGGNDFALGVKSTILAEAVVGSKQMTDDDLPGAIMHELGHTLGLAHGGPSVEHVFNPNYDGVMSYTNVIPDALYRLGRAAQSYGANRPLDYSRQARQQLNEGALSESMTVISPLGPGAPDTRLVPAGTRWRKDAKSPEHTPAGSIFQLVPAQGRGGKQFIDWNGNGKLDPGLIQVDLNNDGKYTELVPAEDWSRLIFNFRESPTGGDVNGLGEEEVAEPDDFGYSAVFGTPAAVEPIVVGADAGNAPEVQILWPDGTSTRFLAFDAGFKGGVRVAKGDLNGDGTLELIAAMGPGGSKIHLYTLEDTHAVTDAGTLDLFPGYTGGLNVAIGDVFSQGGAKDLIVAGATAGTGPALLRVLAGENLGTFRDLSARVPLRTGLTVAAGDVDGDGRDDVIVGYGASTGVQTISTFRLNGGVSGSETKLLHNISPQLPGTGVWLAAGDLNGDGKADIIAGTGAGTYSATRPLVRVYSGANRSLLHSFLADDEAFKGGVRVAVVRLEDHSLGVVTGTGPGKRLVRRFQALLAEVESQNEAFDAGMNGVFVG